ncbi:hypothetical protein BGW80DRAFT_1330266 [Lactifluus volemus]|nr:hypothetical protein BGW80DRAFT_1330266 [Lactifluus volemus]
MPSFTHRHDKKTRSASSLHPRWHLFISAVFHIVLVFGLVMPSSLWTTIDSCLHVAFRVTDSWLHECFISLHKIVPVFMRLLCLNFFFSIVHVLHSWGGKCY